MWRVAGEECVYIEYIMCMLCAAGEKCVYIEYIMCTLCVHYVSQAKSVCTLSTV